MSGESELQGVMDGSIGFFWPTLRKPPLNSTPLRGYLQLNDRDLLDLVALDENVDLDRMFGENSTAPVKHVVGATQHTGVLLLHPRGRRASMQMGGSRASIQAYTFETIVSDVPIHSMKSPKFTSVSAIFPRMLRWAQMSASSVERELKNDGRMKAIVIRLDANDVSECVKIGDGRTLTISPHWSTSGPDEERIVRTALEVEVSCAKPRSIEDLLEPIYAVQDLLSLAHGEFVVCTQGRAAIHREPDPMSNRSYFWDRRLMVDMQETGAKRDFFPSISFGDMGGIAGVRRWLKFESEYPRFVRPLTWTWRMGLGNGAAETRLLELHAAIEQLTSRIAAE